MNTVSIFDGLSIAVEFTTDADSIVYQLEEVESWSEYTISLAG